MTPIVQKIAAAKPDAIIGGTQDGDGYALVKAMVQAKFSPKFLFLANGPNSPAEFPSKVGAKNVNGIFSAGDWFPQAKSPGNAAFVKAYLKAYGGTADAIDPTARPRRTPSARSSRPSRRRSHSLDNKKIIAALHKGTLADGRGQPALERDRRAAGQATCSSSGSAASSTRRSRRASPCSKPVVAEARLGRSSGGTRREGVDVHEVVQAVILGVLIGGVYALMASGLTLVFGIMQVINVAQGALVILAAYLSYALFSHLHIDPFLSILIVTPAMFVLGVAVQLVFVRSLRGARRVGALAARHLGARARDRGRAQRRSSRRRTASTIPSYADSTWTSSATSSRRARARASSLSVVILLAALAAAHADALRPRRSAPPCRTRRRRRCSASTRTACRRSASASASRLAAAAGAVYGVIYPFNPGSHYDLISRLLSIVVLGGLGSLGGAVVAALAAWASPRRSSRSSSRRSGRRSRSSSS